MAFNDLASNQLVSFNEMQSSGIPLNSGQSGSSSLEIMTKLDATTRYNLNLSNATLAAKSNNQCVAKRDLEAAVTSYSHWLSYSATSTDICLGPTFEYFSNVAVLADGERIYSNAALTTYPPAGYYSDGGTVWQANNVGLLSFVEFCGSNF